MDCLAKPYQQSLTALQMRSAAAFRGASAVKPTRSIELQERSRVRSHLSTNGNEKAMGMRAYLREVQGGDIALLSDSKRFMDLFRRGDQAVLSLEKSWDGLHHLLTATSEQAELGFLFGGGTETGLDPGYGRPRVLPPDFVKRLDAALNRISDDQFWSGFNARRFDAEGVYPWIWHEPVEDLREEYISCLSDLRRFVQRVAASGRELLVVIL